MTQTLRQQAQSDPRARQMLEMIQGKTPEEIVQTAQNLYQSQGKDFNEIAQQIRKQIGV